MVDERKQKPRTGCTALSSFFATLIKSLFDTTRTRNSRVTAVVDVMAVIVAATSVTRRYPHKASKASHQNQRKKLRSVWEQRGNTSRRRYDCSTFARFFDDLVVRFGRHVMEQVAILVRNLHVVRVNSRRGERHGALPVGMLTAISSVRAWGPLTEPDGTPHAQEPTIAAPGPSQHLTSSGVHRSSRHPRHDQGD